jgi:hypothetical protein
MPYLCGDSIHILDVGASDYSLFEETSLDHKLIDALDIKINSDHVGLTGISYFKGNITDQKILKNNFYDLVFDSHCLHCLKTNEEQMLALENIYSSLHKGGFFASEIMVQPYKNKVVFPQRNVREVRELETMILNTGFKIVYFIIVQEMCFSTDVNEREILCDLLRVVAIK